LLLSIDDFVEQLTGIFLGIFGGLLHSFSRFFKGFICYVCGIVHVVIRHSTAAIVAHRKLSFLAFAGIMGGRCFELLSLPFKQLALKRSFDRLIHCFVCCPLDGWSNHRKHQALTDIPLGRFLFSLFSCHTISMAQEATLCAPYRGSMPIMIIEVGNPHGEPNPERAPVVRFMLRIRSAGVSQVAG
jgi:hypothetical protein